MSRPLNKIAKLPSFEPLITMTVSGIESILANYREEHSDTDFYAYVLTTYGGLEGFGFHANDEETYEKTLIQAGTYESPKRAKKYNEFNYYKWFWGEWEKNEYIGNQDPLNASYKWLTEIYEMLDDAYPDGENWFEEMTRATHDAMIEILIRLDNKQVFGIGDDRKKCLIYAGVYDSEDDLIKRSLRELNTPQNLAENWPNFEEGL